MKIIQAATILFTAALCTTTWSATPATQLAGPATLPTSVGDVRFDPPEGWIATNKGNIIFFDAPSRAENESCRIALPPSFPIKGNFREDFDWIQQPDPIVETSGVVPGHDSRGNDTLRITKLVKVGSRGAQLYRAYYAVHVGNRFTFTIFTASTKELFEKHLPEYTALTASLDIAEQKPNRP